MIVGLDLSLTCTGISDGLRHEVIKTVPGDGTTAQNNMVRSNEIVAAIEQFINSDWGDDVELWIEGPMLNAQGASHLYDIGWLYAFVYTTFDAHYMFPIYEIQPTTLKKWITGNGQSKKKHKDGCTPEKLCVVHGAEQKWGVTFEKDAGLDKLHAFALVKYGEAVAAGEIEYVAPNRRGIKKRPKKRKDKALGERGTGTLTEQRVNRRRAISKL